MEAPIQRDSPGVQANGFSDGRRTGHRDLETTSPDGEGTTETRSKHRRGSRQVTSQTGVQAEKRDPIGNARGERRRRRIWSEVSDPQRVVAVSGGQARTTRSRVGSVPFRLPSSDGGPRASSVFSREDQLSTVPHRTRTGSGDHADRRQQQDPSPTHPAIGPRDRSLRRLLTTRLHAIESSGYPHRRPDFLTFSARTRPSPPMRVRRRLHSIRQ